MKLHISKKAMLRLPEELRHKSNNTLVQKMQVIALISHPDTKEKMREYYRDVLKELQAKPIQAMPQLSRRVH